jgi:hypothetical protein
MSYEPACRQAGYELNPICHEAFINALLIPNAFWATCGAGIILFAL